MTKRLLVVSCLLTGGCVGAMDNVPVLDPSARNVELSTATPSGCLPKGEVIGKASAEGDLPAALQGARNDLRNQATRLGANYVTMQNTAADESAGMWGHSKDIAISGSAFACPVPSAVVPTPAAAASTLPAPVAPAQPAQPAAPQPAAPQPAVAPTK